MNKKIFIIDDDESILKSLQRTLEKQEYEVSTYKSGDTFLRKIEEKEPAVVIIDINLGAEQPHGADLTKVIKAEHPNIQPVIISGESDVQKTLECMKNGYWIDGG